MSIRVCLAGATGWAGSALAKAILKTDDLELVGAVSRTHAGKPLGDVLGMPGTQLRISGSVEDAFTTTCDVFVEYTKPDAAKHHINTAIESGAHVVVGTSGLSDEDYAEIDGTARSRSKGVLAAGNFSLTAAFMLKFAEMAANQISHFEIIDCAHAEKLDSPSGTARELSHRLGRIRDSVLDVPIEKTNGPKESRGTRMNGVQVHSVRLPGYVISAEIIFGMPDQKLIIRHEAGGGAEPYADGAILAIRKVGEFTGLRRGLDTVMDFEQSS